MAKTKKKENNIGIGILGIIVGIIATVLFVRNASKPLIMTNADVAKELIQEFKEVEEVCGVQNVTEICNDKESYCKNPDAFTCDSWKKALHKEDYDEDGFRIREDN